MWSFLRNTFVDVLLAADISGRNLHRENYCGLICGVANGCRQLSWPFRTGCNWGHNAKQGRSAAYCGLQTHKYKILKLVNTSEGSNRYGNVVRTGSSGLETELEGQQAMSGPPGSLIYVWDLIVWMLFGSFDLIYRRLDKECKGLRIVICGLNLDKRYILTFRHRASSI